jgi:hypothetical protein
MLKFPKRGYFPEKKYPYSTTEKASDKTNLNYQITTKTEAFNR